MVNDSGAPNRSLEPPRLAAAVIAIAAPPSIKEALIGDLGEEYVRMAARSAQRARFWYWRQIVFSLPHFAGDHMRSIEFRRFVLTLLAAAGAYFLVRYWDIFVARSAARTVYQILDTQSYTPSRVVYFTIHAAGFAAAGAVVALTAFVHNQRFFQNAARRLTPAAAVLFTPVIASIMTGADVYPFALRIMQITLSSIALLCGAWLASRLTQNMRD